MAGAPQREPAAPVTANLAGLLGELGLDDLLRHVQAVAAGVRGCYLVGGAVRDLLLREPGFDVDLAVEGDGIAFATELAARLKGHVRPHEKFGTAVVVSEGAAGRLRVDVASTRAESYEYPGALPKVEHAGIRSDLARRDFSINAMAVSLKPETFGDLFDYFGGREDLDARRIVVLHNLSFIEDPTRILRAIRYESRYGLRMDGHTLNLARACCAMDLVGDLSSARLRDELVSLLDEEKVDFALRRAEELGVWPAIHGRLRVDADTRRLVRRADGLRDAHRLEDEAAALAAPPRLAADGPGSGGDRRAGRCACACAASTPACSSGRWSSAGASWTASRAGRARRSCTTWPPASRWRPCWPR